MTEADILIRNRIRDIIDWFRRDRGISRHYLAALRVHREEFDNRITRCQEAPTDESYGRFITSCNELQDLMGRIIQRTNNQTVLFTNMSLEFLMLVDVLRRFISTMKIHRNEETLLRFVKYCSMTYIVNRGRAISTNEPLINKFGQENLTQIYGRCIELNEIAQSITLGERGPSYRTHDRPVGNDQDLLRFHMIQDIIRYLEYLGNSTRNLPDEFYLVESLTMMLKAINECFEDFYNEYYMEYPVRDDDPIVYIIPNPDHG